MGWLGPERERTVAALLAKIAKFSHNETSRREDSSEHEQDLWQFHPRVAAP
jgi:hypothetical protein